MARTKGSITRCGYCGGRGHNKRTCPELQKMIDKHPDGYYANERKRVNARKRTCSYCGETGHNRATCSQLSMDRTAYEHMNWKYQTRIQNAMNEAGFGVGSLIMQKHWDSNRLWMVTKINPEVINLANFWRSAMGNPIKGENGRGLTSDERRRMYALEVKRVDIGNLTERERRYASNLDSMLHIPTFLQTEAMNGHTAHGYSTDCTMVAPVAPMNLEFDRSSGSDWMTSPDYKNGYASQYIESMKETIEMIEKSEPTRK